VIGSLFQRQSGRLKGRWVLTFVAPDGRPKQVLAPPEVEIVPGHQTARFASERQEKRGLK
jgi:hypothetical protein